MDMHLNGLKQKDCDAAPVSLASILATQLVRASLNFSASVKVGMFSDMMLSISSSPTACAARKPVSALSAFYHRHEQVGKQLQASMRPGRLLCAMAYVPDLVMLDSSYQVASHPVLQSTATFMSKS